MNWRSPLHRLSLSQPDPSASQPGRSRRVLLFWLITLSFPVLVLLVIEGLFALRFKRDYPHSSLSVQGHYRFVAAPYRNYGNNPGYVRRVDGVTYRYNNCGFRGEDDLGEKGPNEFRVFFMGGSASYGDPAWKRGQYRLITGQETYPSSETVAAHLEEQLQRAMPHRDVRVINAAVPNYSIQHVYLTYLGLVRLLAPDLIVTMDGWNEDYGSANAYVRAISPMEKSGSALITFLRTHSHTLYYLGFIVADLFSHSAVKHFDEVTLEDFDFEQTRRKLSEYLRTSTPKVEVFDDLMKVYESFWHATQMDGVPILFTTQPLPMLDTTKPLTTEEEKLINYLLLQGKQQDSVGVAHLSERLARRGDADFRFLNLQPAFADLPDLAYIDYCHLTPAANRHLAKRLARYIKSIPQWTHRELARPRSLPVARGRLGVDPSCGGLR